MKIDKINTSGSIFCTLATIVVIAMVTNGNAKAELMLNTDPAGALVASSFLWWPSCIFLRRSPLSPKTNAYAPIPKPRSDGIKESAMSWGFASISNEYGIQPQGIGIAASKIDTKIGQPKVLSQYFAGAIFSKKYSDPSLA